MQLLITAINTVTDATQSYWGRDKRPIFCWQQRQSYLFLWIWCLDSNLTEICSPKWPPSNTSTSSDNGFVPSDQQAIIWTIYGLVHRRLKSSFGLDEAMLQVIFNRMLHGATCHEFPGVVTLACLLAFQLWPIFANTAPQLYMFELLESLITSNELSKESVACFNITMASNLCHNHRISTKEFPIPVRRHLYI